MGYWKKHQKKDLEKVLQALHERGWRIIDPPKYYTARCPCGQCQLQVHLTPSSRHHGNTVLRLARQCPQHDSAPNGRRDHGYVHRGGV